ncbi:hypothetical protein B0187_06320 [Haemophilus paracuniculus]|uniref:Host cell division inhibitor Icd-like protein n=1 Tax=Haemophilus paracuniculus TaxID=734 RepID=A0A1T0ARG9_9PAST|nr:ash family protein [Haemophilus paracuniculus]OOR98874.1 hypothetical protein B0187_06320 [Haemophilus paracuniculus]
MNNTPLFNHFHLNLHQDENNSHKKPFTSGTISAKFCTAVLNQTAEPENSIQTKGEQHAQRAFFVRSFYTPQARPETLSGSECLSMVVRNGKGSPFADFPLVSVSQPVTHYRPNPEKFSGSPENLPKGLFTMIYKFLTLGERRLRITILANSQAEALSRIQFTQRPVLIARLPSKSEVVYA